MGHSGEGELLLGHAVSGGWVGVAVDGSFEGQPVVGVGQLLGQAATPERGQLRGSSW